MSRLFCFFVSRLPCIEGHHCLDIDGACWSPALSVARLAQSLCGLSYGWRSDDEDWRHTGRVCWVIQIQMIHYDLPLLLFTKRVCYKRRFWLTTCHKWLTRSDRAKYNQEARQCTLRHALTEHGSEICRVFFGSLEKIPWERTTRRCL